MQAENGKKNPNILIESVWKLVIVAIPCCPPLPLEAVSVCGLVSPNSIIHGPQGGWSQVWSLNILGLDQWQLAQHI